YPIVRSPCCSCLRFFGQLTAWSRISHEACEAASILLQVRFRIDIARFATVEPFPAHRTGVTGVYKDVDGAFHTTAAISETERFACFCRIVRQWFLIDVDMPDP